MNRSARLRLSAALLFISLAVPPLAAVPVKFSKELLSWWTSSAVDSKGVRHQAKDYPGGRAPWMEDVTRKITPEYSKIHQGLGRGGFGLYRVSLDVKTGIPESVGVVRSTEIPALDESALKALRQWTWKPQRWKEVQIPISFLPAFR